MDEEEALIRSTTGIVHKPIGEYKPPNAATRSARAPAPRAKRRQAAEEGESDTTTQSVEADDDLEFATASTKPAEEDEHEDVGRTRASRRKKQPATRPATRPTEPPVPQIRTEEPLRPLKDIGLAEGMFITMEAEGWDADLPTRIPIDDGAGGHKGFLGAGWILSMDDQTIQVHLLQMVKDNPSHLTLAPVLYPLDANENEQTLYTVHLGVKPTIKKLPKEVLDEVLKVYMWSPPAPAPVPEPPPAPASPPAAPGRTYMSLRPRRAATTRKQ